LTIERGRDTEFRVCLSTFQGKPYVSLRVWQLDPDSGEWWPVKGKGCSVRLSEAARLADALRAVAEDRPRNLSEPSATRSPLSARRPKAAPASPPPRSWAANLPAGPTSAAEFSEFD
jgi:hypothetical protein